MGKFIQWMAVCMAPAVCAQAQSIDPSFGDGGQFTLELAGASSHSSRMIRAADGSSFIAGMTPAMPSPVQVLGEGGALFTYVPTNATRDMFIAKLTPAGELDRSFSGDGIATIDFSGRDDRAYALVLQGDGKLVIAGMAEASAGQFDLAIARLTANGALDPSFNGTGKVLLDLGGTEDYAIDVKGLSNGALLVAGSSGTLATETTQPGLVQPVVAKLRADGSLDATFDGDGVAMPVLSAPMWPQSLLLGSDGKIILTGTLNSTVGLVGLNANGALDESFGMGGVWTFNSGGEVLPLSPLSALPTPEGGFLLAGLAFRYTSPNLGSFISRFGGSGAPDASFGAGGTPMFFIPSEYSYASGIALEPNGKILVAGIASRADASSPGDPYVARLLPDGSLDETFGEQGVMLVEPNDSSLNSAIHSLTRAANGRLQLSGFQGEYTNDGGFLGGDMVQETERAFVIQLTSTPTFGFAASTASVNESDGSVQLTVSRIGTTTGTVSVKYSTAAFGSTPASGFTPTSGTLSWAPNDPPTKTITVGIVADSVDRPNQQFSVVLSEPSEGSTDAIESVVVSIVDDDEPAPGGGNGGGSNGGGGSFGFGGLSLLLGFLLQSRWRLAKGNAARY